VLHRGYSLPFKGESAEDFASTSGRVKHLDGDSPFDRFVLVRQVHSAALTTRERSDHAVRTDGDGMIDGLGRPKRLCSESVGIEVIRGAERRTFKKAVTVAFMRGNEGVQLHANVGGTRRVFSENSFSSLPRQVVHRKKKARRTVFDRATVHP
jgi:hypothetical protein